MSLDSSCQSFLGVHMGEPRVRESTWLERAPLAVDPSCQSLRPPSSCPSKCHASVMLTWALLVWLGSGSDGGVTSVEKRLHAVQLCSCQCDSAAHRAAPTSLLSQAQAALKRPTRSAQTGWQCAYPPPVYITHCIVQTSDVVHTACLALSPSYRAR